MKNFFVGVIILLGLTACAAGGTVTNGGTPLVGPQSGVYQPQSTVQMASVHRVLLDVVVPVFDPGLPENVSSYKENGIWPELRNAEANMFADELKDALEGTSQFDTVRITPDTTEAGSVYALGRIVESDGEDLEIEVTVIDSRNQILGSKKFENRVEPKFYEQGLRNRGVNPHQVVFEEAATFVVEVISKISDADRNHLRNLADIRFAAGFLSEEYSQYYEQNGSKLTLVSLPSEADPMFQRVGAIRNRHNSFVDDLQIEYQAFSGGLRDDYLVWQQASAEQQAELRAARRSGWVKGILGAGLMIAGAAMAADGSSAASAAGAAGAILGGAALAESAYRDFEDVEQHIDNLNQLGQSIEISASDRVIEFEGHTEELVGSTTDQYKQWSAFLRRVYLEDQTPSQQL